MKTIFLCIVMLAVTFSGCRKTLILKEEYVINTEAFHNRNRGASARELLDDREYKSLMVEIQYMPGFSPKPQTLDYLRKFLQTYLARQYFQDTVLPHGYHPLPPRFGQKIGFGRAFQD